MNTLSRTSTAFAHAWPLRTQGERFRDALGRQILLRGVNLGGDSKLPFPYGGTQYPDDFSNHRTVSFTGRPFPLAEADAHFTRLRQWGFNCLRLLTTWEAVEHAGPGLYDTTYLDYFAEICRQAGAHGFAVFIDFHQDVWSRMSGGDGAPGWVFEAVGLDFTKFGITGAAHVMQQRFDHNDANPHQSSYPQMSWAQNYRMPANAIMWTLFWGGAHVTPDFGIHGVNVQTYLQGHLLGAMQQVALRVADIPCVIGFDSLNEPGVGWLGQALSPQVIDGQRRFSGLPLPGSIWSPIEALAVAQGVQTTLDVRPMPGNNLGEAAPASVTVNAAGLRIWRDGVPCPFECAGIYRMHDGRALALREQAFSHWEGRPVDLPNDVFAPFFSRVASTLRAVQPNWLLFAEMDPMGSLLGQKLPADMPVQSVNACHWYDVTLLVSKQFDEKQSVDLFTGEVAMGRDAIGARYTKQLADSKSTGARVAGGMPTLIGEFGIPYDLNGACAYRAWAAGDHSDALWHDHTLALELMYNALDTLHLSSTQWNYTAGNRNDARIGDQWNQEDLSIYSADQGGGRAMLGFCRPYARAVQGDLVSMRFEREAIVFELVFVANLEIDAPTEVFLPNLQYASGVAVALEGAHARFLLDPPSQSLQIWAIDAGTIKVTCTRIAEPQ